MGELKTSSLYTRKYDWKNVKVETERVSKVLQYIPTDNITELNELI